MLSAGWAGPFSCLTVFGVDRADRFALAVETGAGAFAFGSANVSSRRPAARSGVIASRGFSPIVLRFAIYSLFPSREQTVTRERLLIQETDFLAA